MKSTLISTDNSRILYDATALDAPEAAQFDPSYWENRDAVIARPAGRGSAVVISYSKGEAVLKRYFRGGMMAKVNQALYLFTGYERSRAFREFRLLQTMHSYSLPVPEPLAVICERRGLLASMALLTKRIADTETLAARQMQQMVSISDWEMLGKTLKRFHENGIFHADLNANNVLLDTAGRVFLIDFDKCKHKHPDAIWHKKNIKRLKRSLEKLFPGDLFPRAGWDVLVRAYAKEA